MKKKFKHRVKSFAEVMALMNPDFVPADKKERRRICRMCGSTMKRVPGTNVWRCTAAYCCNTIFNRLHGGETIKAPPHTAVS